MDRPQPHVPDVPSAPRAPLPARFEPQLAALATRAPEGDRWLHEIKYDGYRIGCRIDGGQVRLISRRGNDWTRAFAPIAQAAKKLKLEQGLLDGEVAALAPDGRTDFQLLQNALSGVKGPRIQLVYFVFDLLHLDGRDLTRLPLEERKRILAAVVPDAHGPIQRAQAWVGRGPELFAKACELGLEGIVCKRRDAAYRAGRSDCWLKVKCTRSEVFVIGGFTEPEGTPASGFGALLVGQEEEDHLRFVGKVGTGFSEQTMRSLRQLLEAERSDFCPFDPRPPGWLGRHARWVRPLHRAKVRFTEWTDGGNIRHPSFLGLCDVGPAASGSAPGGDSAARSSTAASTSPAIGSSDARRSTRAATTGSRAAASTPGAAAPHPASEAREAATVTRPPPRSAPRGRVIPHEDDLLSPGLTRRALIEHYERIAEWMLPHVRGRPLTLVRCKQDLASCTFMHHAGNLWAPAEVPRLSIRERTKVGEYLVIERPEHLVELARAGVVEFHTWNTRAEAVELPDRLVFDLDPGPEVRWAQTVAAAKWMRGALESVGLVSFVKTTGGVGLHVVVPIVPREDWSHCFAFARAFASLAAQERPLFTTALARKGREAQILIDYLRNNRTNTSVAAYSVRARAEATISVPLSWEELSARMDPLKLNLAAVQRRMKRLRRDPWEKAAALRQELPLAAADG